MNNELLISHTGQQLELLTRIASAQRSQYSGSAPVSLTDIKERKE